jgi:AcrR family transcriptional regulator
MGTNNPAGRIAHVAPTILQKEGPEAVSMRRVAETVGIAPMAIYHHFPSRDALLNTITGREFAKLLSYMQAHPLHGGVEDRLLAVMSAYVDYAFAQPRIFDFIFPVLVHERVNSRKIFGLVVLLR